MLVVGTFEAKTHLSALLERVQHGEEVAITKHGKEIARLVPSKAGKPGDADAAIIGLLDLRKGTRLDGLDWKELRDADRR